MLLKNGDFWTSKKRGIWQVNTNTEAKIYPNSMSQSSPLKESMAYAFDFVEVQIDNKIDPWTGNSIFRRTD